MLREQRAADRDSVFGGFTGRGNGNLIVNDDIDLDTAVCDDRLYFKIGRELKERQDPVDPESRHPEHLKNILYRCNINVKRCINGHFGRPVLIIGSIFFIAFESRFPGDRCRRFGLPGIDKH